MPHWLEALNCATWLAKTCSEVPVKAFQAWRVTPRKAAGSSLITTVGVGARLGVGEGMPGRVGASGVGAGGVGVPVVQAHSSAADNSTAARERETWGFI